MTGRYFNSIDRCYSSHTTRTLSYRVHDEEDLENLVDAASLALIDVEIAMMEVVLSPLFVIIIIIIIIIK